MSRLDELYARLGPDAAARLAQLAPRIDETPGAPAEAMARLGLPWTAELAAVEGRIGGLSHQAYETPEDRWSWGVHGTIDGVVRPFPDDVAAVLAAHPERSLVPVCDHPDGELYLDGRLVVVGYYPIRRELIEMADSVEVFLRRLLHGWLGHEGHHAHQVDGGVGVAWAGRLGLEAVPERSDRYEQWWRGEGVAIQQVTRDGDAVWSAARYDVGFDGRFTVLWADSEERLAACVAR